VPILILTGLLPYIIIAMIMTKRLKVQVPLCERHRGHWRSRTLFLVLSFLGLIGLTVGGAFLSATLDKGGRGDTIGLVFLGFGVLLVVWLIIAAVLNKNAIHAGEITDYDIKLVKVSEGFRDAVEDMRESYRTRRGTGRYQDDDDPEENDYRRGPRPPRPPVRDDEDYRPGDRRIRR
jgi:hypothetical protein